MHTYRTILMDLDGTLVDSNDAHASAWTSALRDAGYDVAFADVRERIGMGAERMLYELASLSLDDARAQRVRADYAHLFESVHLPRVSVLPGARDLLARIKHEGLTLVLATPSGSEQTRQLLEHAQLIPAFDYVVTGDELLSARPTEPVRTALERAGTRASEALLIGDTPYDIARARSAGVAALALRSGGWPDAALAGAVAVYADARDLLTHFGMSPLSRLPAPAHELDFVRGAAA